MSDNNRANQLNPNNRSYWSSRGFPGKPSEDMRSSYYDDNPSPNYSRHDLNNRSNQLNPNNPAYHSSRGSEEKSSWCVVL